MPFQSSSLGTLFVDIPKFSGAARVGVRVAVVVAGDRVAGPLEEGFDQQLILKRNNWRWTGKNKSYQSSLNCG